MTWAEFKASIEQQGVSDDMRMDSIDFSVYDYNGSTDDDHQPLVLFNEPNDDTDFWVM